tara:strand:+ start:34691 stop:35056 length:366 start_codon:yes stop_codon:yes gene_type:complete
MDEVKLAVLVVEDEVLLRIATAEILDDSGFLVHQAGSAEEALRILAREPAIDVVFTDIDMPGILNGLDLAARVINGEPDIAVLVTSGGSTPPPELTVDFLPKPYDFDALPAQILALKPPRP